MFQFPLPSRPPAPVRKLTLLFCLLGLSGMAPAGEAAPLNDYLDLSLQDLLSVEVSSVSKKLQLLRESAAAVYVVSDEDIRRLGATSIPEALAMVPGVHVGRINGNQQSVSIRGFSSRYSNKLLVLVDGRSVYVPSFSGVYWDELNVLMEDIARIEVIRGPGATLWGANAVNGIINILTRDAADTLGGFAKIGAGSGDLTGISARQGFTLGDSVEGRIHAKRIQRGSEQLLAGGNAHDGLTSKSAGFRLDSAPSPSDHWTLQGDVFANDGSQLDAQLPFSGPFDLDSRGWNLMGLWERSLGNAESLSLQVYFSHTDRIEHFLEQSHDTLDIQFQHRFSPLADHDVIWGLGYRQVDDEFVNSARFSLLPASRDERYPSAFVQDEISFDAQDLKLIIGSKFEDNPHTGVEFQPNVRALWQTNEDNTLWVSVARAVRTPARIELDGLVQIAPFFFLMGNPEQLSEELIAYEVGHRWFGSDTLSTDTTLFYNDYDRIVTTRPVAGGVMFDNSVGGYSYGIESAVDWWVRSDWRLRLSYSYLSLHLDKADGTSLVTTNQATPQHQLALQSGFDLAEDLTLDVWAKYTSDMPVPGSTGQFHGLTIDEHVSLNLRLAWRPTRKMELSLTGRDLLGDRHTESFGEIYTPPTKVGRSLFGEVRVDW